MSGRAAVPNTLTSVPQAGSWLFPLGKLLATSDKNTKQYPPIGELIAKAKAAQLDGLDLHYGFPIDADFVKQVHNAGLKLYVWTVDDPAIATRLAAAGVDGITTNRPEWLRQQLAQGK